jgi:hypothetical protein
MTCLLVHLNKADQDPVCSQRSDPDPGPKPDRIRNTGGGGYRFVQNIGSFQYTERHPWQFNESTTGNTVNDITGSPLKGELGNTQTFNPGKTLIIDIPPVSLASSYPAGNYRLGA